MSDLTRPSAQRHEPDAHGLGRRLHLRLAVVSSPAERAAGTVTPPAHRAGPETAQRTRRHGESSRAHSTVKLQGLPVITTRATDS